MALLELAPSFDLRLDEFGQSGFIAIVERFGIEPPASGLMMCSASSSISSSIFMAGTSLKASSSERTSYSKFNVVAIASR
jgi:hypothetical protein